ncbi:uncharacterized protein Z518_05705 [Rhinocladiella mackenziei CBS 650.93]|uniref:Major facilitator superfamily (MFS) profile domain-containing protein n=1 Tax=Rhinocladiella mackenziei CBS 650.93 TaxID=1442369 RepID=A0A0D2IGC4_9EURO|nr:uncharacterized protein Z518_05705 [Rhinocladiella mackenziei CBS 650.93]KIX04834.1 hypothetical protein Z518_05705 [Rhinocladiella mackenziei CBS 650.93]
MTISNTPVYMSEISPPITRGFLWRLNYVVSVFFGIVFAISLFFLPESPRWLVEQGRYEEAAAILERLHRSKLDPKGTVAHAEMTQIQAQVEVEKSMPRGYLYILKTPSLRWRFFCTALVWGMGQSTGINVIATLTPVLFSKLGYGTTLQLGLTVVWTVCLQIGCIVNVLIVDRIGRKNLLGTAVLLSIEAALEKYYLNSTNAAGIKACVAIYFIFATWFTSTIECTGYVYASEIWPTHLRSYGATITYTAFFATALAYSTPASSAFSAIGWKYYMVFVAVTVPAVIAIWKLFPETKGLTLEEIGQKFNDPVSLTFEDAAARNLETSERIDKMGQDSANTCMSSSNEKTTGISDAAEA